MRNIIGVDLGGTSVKCGRIEDDQIVELVTSDTQAYVGGRRTLEIIRTAISALIREDTDAIGVGVPSVVDRKKGIVYNVQNISGWDEVPLKSILEDEFGIPVYLDNDANCFAFGERIYGKGRDFSDFVGVTLGTGLGSGIIQKGGLLSDANCGSGEFGEIPYMDTKLEDYCGSCFFSKTEFGTGYEAWKMACKGNESALKCFEEYGKHLAYLVKVIVLVLDPQAIIFGGAIARSFDLFENAIRSNLCGFPYPKSIERLSIMATQLNNTGILGAGSLCFRSV